VDDGAREERVGAGRKGWTSALAQSQGSALGHLRAGRSLDRPGLVGCPGAAHCGESEGWTTAHSETRQEPKEGGSGRSLGPSAAQTLDQDPESFWEEDSDRTSGEKTWNPLLPLVPAQYCYLLNGL
jgi:hypothetical protein